MSIDNILSITPFNGGCVVIFRVHGGEGTRSYTYYGMDAEAVLAGNDPATYYGVQGGGTGMPSGIGGEIAGSGETGAAIATDIGEIGEIGLIL